MGATKPWTTSAPISACRRRSEQSCRRSISWRWRRVTASRAAASPAPPISPRFCARRSPPTRRAWWRSPSMTKLEPQPTQRHLGRTHMRATMGLTAALAALLGVAALGAAQAADPVTIRLSYVVPVSDLPSPTLPVAIQNAGLSDLQVIADGFQDGPRYSNEFMVLTDGPVKKIEDMKGKVVASNAIGSGVDIAM